ncbi:60S ribosomal protein L13A [Orobanche hederae]
MFVWETIRGCIPDETEKGKDALARLEVHEDLPYDNLKILDNVKNGRTAKIRAAFRIGDEEEEEQEISVTEEAIEKIRSQR